MAQNGLYVGPSLPGMEEVAPAGPFSGIPEHPIGGLWPCLLVSFLYQQVSGSRLTRTWRGGSAQHSAYEAGRNLVIKQVSLCKQFEKPPQLHGVLAAACPAVLGESAARGFHGKTLVPVGLCVAGLECEYAYAQIRINWQGHGCHCRNRKFLPEMSFRELSSKGFIIIIKVSLPGLIVCSDHPLCLFPLCPRRTLFFPLLHLCYFVKRMTGQFLRFLNIDVVALTQLFGKRSRFKSFSLPSKNRTFSPNPQFHVSQMTTHP